VRKSCWQVVGGVFMCANTTGPWAGLAGVKGHALIFRLCRNAPPLRGSTLSATSMTKGTVPGAHGCSQSRPSRRQTPNPLLTLAHHRPCRVFPAGGRVPHSLAEAPAQLDGTRAPRARRRGSLRASRGIPMNSTPPVSAAPVWDRKQLQALWLASAQEPAIQDSSCPANRYSLICWV
jgi:hypothetical protein